jgi:carboxypeptidase T
MRIPTLVRRTRTRLLRSLALLAPALLLAVSPAAAASEFPAGYEAYHTYAELTSEILAVAAAHPGIVAVSSFGKSYEDRTLWAVKVSDNAGVDEAEPEVLVVAGTHAREHLSVEAALVVLNWLVDGYDHDSSIIKLVNTREIWILPEINPDGAEYDIEGGSFHAWRKNRQPTPGSSQIGTDINRNFGYRWGCCGNTSANPASSVYRGPAPFSTPEAKAIRNFVKGRIVRGAQQIRVVLNIHTYGMHILYPYGYTANPLPPDMRPRDHVAFVKLSAAMAAMNGYSPMQESSLYVNSGGLTDWVYGNQRIFGFTFELGPRTAAGGGFYPAGSRIKPLTAVNRSAILYLFRVAECPYRAAGEASYCSDLPPLHSG